LPDSHPILGASLGPALEPVLRTVCEGKLSQIRWFRSDWQRGGGSTGLAEFQTGTATVEVVVKLPVGPVEFNWATALGRRADFDPDLPVPHIYAADTALSGYDLAWLVMERLPGQPLGGHLDADGVHAIIHALADWHERASRLQPPGPAPKPADFARAIEHSREVCKHGVLPEHQKWNHELKALQKVLPELVARWEARPMSAWCHGDTHPGNAMRRAPCPGKSVGRGVLIDLALVHPGHWIEDAVYLERVHWGRPEALAGVAPVAALAATRRAAGLRWSEDHGLLAAVRRVLMAGCAPAALEREGNPKYLHAALEVLQRYLPQVTH